MLTIRLLCGWRRLARLLTLAACLAGTAAPAQGDNPPPAKEGDGLKKALQSRLEAAQKVYDVQAEQFKTGRAGIEMLFAAQKQLLLADLDLRDKKEDRVAVCQKNLACAGAAKNLADARLKNGLGGIADAAQAEYEVRDAEVILEREKAK